MVDIMCKITKSRNKDMYLFSHPRKVCMTYFQHANLSLNLACLFAKGSVQALVHAIYPDVYLSSSTDTVNRAKELMSKAGCQESAE